MCLSSYVLYVFLQVTMSEYDGKLIFVYLFKITCEKIKTIYDMWYVYVLYISFQVFHHEQSITQVK